MQNNINSTTHKLQSATSSPTEATQPTTEHRYRTAQARTGADFSIGYPIVFPADSAVTKQSFKEECDINTIMRKYQLNGELPILNQQFPQYLDCTGIEFQTYVDYVSQARDMFMSLPSKIRNEFDNDPALFVDFCSQESNRAQLKEWGLLAPEAEKPPASSAPASPATAEAA
jgi:phage internal scaffolding protein